MRRIFYWLPVLLTSLIGCDHAAPAAETPSNPSATTQSASAGVPPVEAAPTARAAPTSEVNDVNPNPLIVSPVRNSTAVAQASNAVGYDLYARLRGTPGNLVYSPVSLSAALVMTYAGARGETQAEMARVLHLDPKDTGAVSVFGHALQSVAKTKTGTTLRVANRLFGEKSYRFEQPFLDLTKRDFGAELQPVDILGSPEAARGVINQWVLTRTEQKIPDLLPPNALDAASKLVLVNAIYFLGEWAQAFNKASTNDATFTPLDGNPKKVPTMHGTFVASYGEASGVKLLRLKYKGGDISMTVVLPNANDGLSSVEATLNASTVEGWDAAMSQEKTTISLPKFKLEPPTISLGDALKGMGMKLPFDRARADFTAMANPPNDGDRLSIASVFHKAFIAVDEKGTEAAAASAVVMQIRGVGGPTVEPPKQFKADHPFLFLIRDDVTKLVLFAGRVTAP